MTQNPATITVEEAGKLLGIGRSTAFKAAREGNFPTPVIKIGGRYVIPTRPLCELLGLDELPRDAA